MGGGELQENTVLPTTAEQLAAAIRASVDVRGPHSFRRIIIISHAGGAPDGPSLSLGAERLTAQDFKSNAGGLASAIKLALAPDGILVLASCGYYFEESVDAHNVPYRLRGTGTPAQLKSDKEYQKQYWKNLGIIANAVGHPIFNDPVESFPRADPAFAGSDRQFNMNILRKWGPPMRRYGVDASGGAVGVRPSL